MTVFQFSPAQQADASDISTSGDEKSVPTNHAFVVRWPTCENLEDCDDTREDVVKVVP
jgi:hypothetical protein